MKLSKLLIFKDQDNKQTSFSVSVHDRANLVRYTVEQAYSYERHQDDFLFWMNIEKSRNGFFASETHWIFKNGCDNRMRLWHGVGDNQVLAGRFFHQWIVITIAW